MAGKKGMRGAWDFRKRVIIDPEQLKRLAGIGLTMNQIASVFGITPQQVYNRMKQEPELKTAYLKGRAEGCVFVCGKLWERVEAGDLRAIIFWLRCRGGFVPQTEASIHTTIDATSDRITRKVYDPEKNYLEICESLASQREKDEPDTVETAIRHYNEIVEEGKRLKWEAETLSEINITETLPDIPEVSLDIPEVSLDFETSEVNND